MRLPSALAALLAFYQRHGHSIWALAEEDHEQHEHVYSERVVVRGVQVAG